MKRVAIVVPLSNRSTFTADELISLRHLEHHLGRHDRYFVAPESLEVSRPGFGVRRFPGRFFGSVNAHTRLVMSERFYEAFTDYEYILIYHLDALCFSDELIEWCDRGYDLIGAPFFQIVTPAGSNGDGTPQDHVYGEISGSAGNGGFALRRVQACLNVLRSHVPAEDPKEIWRRVTEGRSLPYRLAMLPVRWVKHLKAFNSAKWECTRHWVVEDLFFAHRAAHFAPGFRVAPVPEALRFAFEVKPRRCFELTGGRLPFGCHAWQRYDRSFWEPYLMRDEVTPVNGEPIGAAR